MNFPFPVDDGARLCPVVTTMQVGKEGIRPRLLPAQPATKPARRPGDDQLFRVKENLEAEAAADITGAHANLGGFHAKRLGKLFGDTNRPLRSAPDIERALLRPGSGNHRPGLHRIDDHAVVDHIDLENLATVCLGRGQHGIGAIMVTCHPVESDVVRIFAIELRRPVLHRRIYIGHRGKAVIAGINQLQRVMRRRRILGDDHGDYIACRAVHITHHRRVRDHGHLFAILICQPVPAMDFTNAVGIKIGLCRDKMNTRKRRRRSGIDRQQSCMRQRRAKKRHRETGSRIDIIGITPLAGNKP